jgi:hypothetical protein
MIIIIKMEKDMIHRVLKVDLKAIDRIEIKKEMIQKANHQKNKIIKKK